MIALVSRHAGPLAGNIQVPGDKSISHRALMLGAVTVGGVSISGLLEGEDVLATAAAMRALGATIERLGDGHWQVFGRGIGGLVAPPGILDMGNSGTGARLLLGLLATHPLTAIMSGDSSLSERPMERVMAPLREMGARFVCADDGRLPVTVTGAVDPLPIEYELPVASAQVKSAVLLAGLNTPGRTSVIEPEPTRDHTERMLSHLGADIEISDEDGRRRIVLTGQLEMRGGNITVPGDISSAAFPLVAAIITPGSRLTLRGVGVNPLRVPVIESLREMGAVIEITEQRDEGGELVADLAISASALRSIEVAAEQAQSMIDEYPILAVAAAYAEGTSRFHGLGELRIKESDRLAAIAKGLAAAGVSVEESEDSLTVYGCGGMVPGGAHIAVELDHRIAMAFLVLGLAAQAPVMIDDASVINTSFPNFVTLMNRLGAAIEPT